jgi:D-tagatose-1,6-bisphosphate aldolase subunit GatZ/KbaZ
VAVCSAHPAVIAEAAVLACEKGRPLLVEATANQVDQHGGYTGMTPKRFARFVNETAEKAGLPAGSVLLGADHLGPGTWSAEPAKKAMDRAAELLGQCVAAGFSKIHLDTARPCADDPETGVAGEAAARRAAVLCRTAEETAARTGRRVPFYVIGDEVPAPGGALADGNRPAASSPESVAGTIDRHQTAFLQAGLGEAWGRVAAVVVQPGVEFGDRTVAGYRRKAAEALSRFHGELPGQMTFEVHSADYQGPAALEQMFRAHFLLLKVGPCLTFAYREAIFALALLEKELPDVAVKSGLLEVMEDLMLRMPKHWKDYYGGSKTDQRFLRRYSLRDRIRYYWHLPAAEEAVARLMENLCRPVPAALLHQFLPELAGDVGKGNILLEPKSVVSRSIRRALEPLFDAAGRPPRFDAT